MFGPLSAVVIHRIFLAASPESRKRIASMVSIMPVSGLKRTTKFSSLSSNGTNSSAVLSSTASQRTRGSVSQMDGNQPASAQTARLAAWLVLASSWIFPTGASKKLASST